MTAPFDTHKLTALIDQAQRVLTQLEAVLPQVAQSLKTHSVPEPDWTAPAHRWHAHSDASGQGWLQPIHAMPAIHVTDLQHIERQRTLVEQNTVQFVHGRPANNVLLTGARGTGKSSLIKAVLNQFAKRSLRLIEVDKDDLVHLPEIVDLVFDRREKFIIFCDDLSFEAGEPGYKAMKSVLDGSITGMPDNLLVYATSNRRHLMPEKMAENLEAKYTDEGDVHPGETTEEKISLSDRFGLWLSFYPFGQDEYLAICAHWLMEFGRPAGEIDSARSEALQWAQMRGSRSGRVAWQFARDYAGRHGRAQK